jgi:hypothetical protein
LQHEGRMFCIDSQEFGAARSQTRWYGVFVCMSASPLVTFEKRSIE